MESHDVSLIIQNIQLVNQNVMQIRDELNDKIDSVVNKLDEHEDADKTYWKKIDTQDTQIGLLKLIFGGAILTSVGTFLINWFDVVAHKLGLK
jgi:hypothetical protein